MTEHDFRDQADALVAQLGPEQAMALANALILAAGRAIVRDVATLSLECELLLGRTGRAACREVDSAVRLIGDIRSSA